MSCHSARTPFPCVKCGLCCQRVNLAEETRFLDRGDGTCRYFDGTTRGCTIYSERPEVCHVDLYYERHYTGIYSWEDFVEINLAVCRQLISEEYVSDLV